MSLILLAVFVLVIVFAGIWVMKTYNKMVARRINVESSFAQIEVQLKRRYDLIPNLVETVKGYATHEKETFENVTKARAEAMAANNDPHADPAVQAAAEAALTSSLINLRAIAENYPDLKATENFQQLSEELSSTENKIAVSRQVFNDTVNTYNTTIQQFPASAVAGMFKFEAKEFFDAPDGVEVAPAVSF